MNAISHLLLVPTYGYLFKRGKNVIRFVLTLCVEIYDEDSTPSTDKHGTEIYLNTSALLLF